MALVLVMPNVETVYSFPLLTFIFTTLALAIFFRSASEIENCFLDLDPEYWFQELKEVNASLTSAVKIAPSALKASPDIGVAPPTPAIKNTLEGAASLHLKPRVCQGSDMDAAAETSGSSTIVVPENSSVVIFGLGVMLSLKLLHEESSVISETRRSVLIGFVCGISLILNGLDCASRGRGVGPA
ncbi:hypothetical protein [Teredinibacter turnerae]|uniref:hypothetical protein n=1 Tax=Teredinibacter turnerae TaxID=2426 RepID=UPI0030D1B14C